MFERKWENYSVHSLLFTYGTSLSFSTCSLTMFTTLDDSHGVSYKNDRCAAWTDNFTRHHITEQADGDEDSGAPAIAEAKLVSPTDDVDEFLETSFISR